MASVFEPAEGKEVAPERRPPQSRYPLATRAALEKRMRGVLEVGGVLLVRSGTGAEIELWEACPTSPLWFEERRRVSSGAGLEPELAEAVEARLRETEPNAALWELVPPTSPVGANDESAGEGRVA